MKKLLLVFGLTGIVGGVSAQEAADKTVQAGIVVGYGMNFQKMETKLMNKNGAGSDLTIGANINYSFNETIGLCTGIEFDFETLKYKAGANNVYYFYNDNNLLTHAEALETVASGGDPELYQLSMRKQKPIYLTIPTMVLFRTNFIGYFRYFGKFGLRSSFMLTNKIHDDGANFTPNDILGSVVEPGKNSNMTAKGDMFFFKSAVGLAGGAEWNFTGTTSLVAEIGYYYGFTGLHNSRTKNDKQYLLSTDANNGGGNDVWFANAAKQSQLMFKVSVLF